MRVLIVGARRPGAQLAGDLLHDGHDVRILDADETLLERLPHALQGRALHGSPLERETLAGALAGCDALAVTTGDDALNAVVALAARRELHVPLAVALVVDPARAEGLSGLGAHVLCPTTRTVGELRRMLERSGIDSELRLGADAGVYRCDVPARLEGRALRELERPGRLLVVAVERGGRVLLAVPELVLCAGDVLHVAATDHDDVLDLTGP